MAKRPPNKPAVRRRLEQCRQEQALVRLRRAIPEADAVDGFVIALSHDWVVLARFDPLVLLDGWTALRIQDLQAVSTLAGVESFEVRALKGREQWPPPSPAELDCETATSLLESMAGTAQMTAHRELELEDITRVDFGGRTAETGDGVRRPRASSGTAR